VASAEGSGPTGPSPPAARGRAGAESQPPSEDSPRLLDAGFVSRLAAFAVDLVVLAVGTSATVWVVEAMEALLAPITPFGIRERALALLVPFLPLVYLAYYAGSWTLTGRTLGKRLLGLRVVATDGGPVSLARAVARFAGYLISALPGYAGFLWVLVDPERRGWHDRLAGTRVVYDRPRAREVSRPGARPPPGALPQGAGGRR